jgi:MoxR-like ATPase
MFMILVKYPNAAEELAIMKQVTGTFEDSVIPVLSGDEITTLQKVVRRVPAADHVFEYARDLARATRPGATDAPEFAQELIQWGAGPRAAIALMMAAKARGVLYGRYHATTEDVKAMALPVLRHRVLPTYNAEAAGITPDQIVQRLVEEIHPRDENGLA